MQMLIWCLVEVCQIILLIGINIYVENPIYIISNDIIETFKILFLMKINKLIPANNDIINIKGKKKFIKNEPSSELKKFSMLGMPFIIPELMIKKIMPDTIKTLIRLK